MKKISLLFVILIFGIEFTQAQAKLPIVDTVFSKSEQDIINLSRKKWDWMSEKNVTLLDDLFDSKSVFVHMGGSWGKLQELNVIKSGGIWYKHAEVYGAAVNVFGDMAILLNEIDLVAVVGGNEVVNPFMVTEVYYKVNRTWKLGSLTFSTLRRPVKYKSSN